MRKTELALIISYLIFLLLQTLVFPGKLFFFWLITFTIAAYYGIGGYWVLGGKEDRSPMITIVAGIAFATAIPTIYYNILLRQQEIWKVLPVINILYFAGLSFFLLIIKLKKLNFRHQSKGILLRSGAILLTSSFFAYGTVQSSFYTSVLTALNAGSERRINNLKMFEYDKIVKNNLEQGNCEDAIIAAVKSVEAGNKWLFGNQPPQVKDRDELWKIGATYTSAYSAYKCKGDRHYDNKEFLKALPFYIKADSFLHASPNEKHENWQIERAESKNTIGFCYHNLANYDSASVYYSKAISHYADQVGKKGKRLALYCYNLGNTLKAQGDLVNANDLFSTSINIFKSDSTAENNRNHIGNAYQKIAENYLMLYDLEKALRALVEAQPYLEENSEQNCANKFSMGVVFFGQASYTHAFDVAKEAFACFTSDKNYNQRNVAASYALLFDISLATASYDSAKSYIEKGIAISSKNYATNGAEYHDYIRRLASYYYQTGNYDQARGLYEQVLKVYITELGEENEKVPVVLADLARVLVKLGELEKAKRYVNKCITIANSQNFFHNSSSSNLLNDIAYIKYVNGEIRISDSIYNKALEMALKDAGDSTLSVGSSLNGLGLIAVSRKEYRKANTLFKQSLKLHKKYLGSSHPFSATVLMNKGELKIRENKWEESETHLKSSLETFKKFYAERHPTIGFNLFLLGELFLVKKNVQSKDFYEKALEVYNQSFTADHFKVMNTQKRLGSLR